MDEWDTRGRADDGAGDRVKVDPDDHEKQLHATLEDAIAELSVLERRTVALRAVQRSCESALKVLKEQQELQATAKMAGDSYP